MNASPILRPMNAPALPPRYEIRALHTATTVTVYQAYPPAIGLPAARDPPGCSGTPSATWT